MSTKPDMFLNVSTSILDIYSLKHVLEACCECTVNWSSIGLSLGLGQPLLDLIAATTNDPIQRLQSVLDAWLRKNTIPNSPNPSYYTLCHAIASTTGGRNTALAERIAAAHPASADDIEKSSDTELTDSISTCSGGYYTDDDLNKLCRCGGCSLQQIITDGCPSFGKASLNQFPLLDITQLPDGKRQQYLFMIEKEALKIKKAFANLYTDISTSMKDVDIVQLKTHSRTMGWFDIALDRESLYEKLDRCEDTQSIFLVLSSICSWFNHHPLEPLVDKFGSTEVKTKYEDFVNKTLLPFLKQNIKEIPKHGLGDVIEGSGVFQLKLTTTASSHENIRGEHFYFLKGSVAEALGISPENLHVLSIKEGCFEVTFMVPCVIYKKLFPLSDKHDQALRAISVAVNKYHSLKVKAINENVPISDDGDDTNHLFTTKALAKQNNERLQITAGQLFQRYGQRLSQLVLSVEIVYLLCTEGVISKEILLLSMGGELSDSSIEELCTKVTRDPSLLRVLGTVLLKSEATVPLAYDILKDCDTTFQGTTSKGDRSEEQSTFSNLSEYYSSLITSTRPLIVKGMPTLVEVKSFLSHKFEEMRAQLAHADTAEDVLTLVEENCSVDNVYCLETVIDRYDISKARALLEDYKAEVERVFEQTNLHDCLDVCFILSSFPHHLLKCDTVEFHLSSEYLQRPLKEIKLLLSQFFNDFTNRVLMESIHQQEESIIVRCHAPQYLMNVLQREAKKCSLDNQKGVVSLTVSYSKIGVERQESQQENEALLISEESDGKELLNKSNQENESHQERPLPLEDIKPQTFDQLLQSISVETSVVTRDSTFDDEDTYSFQSFKDIITDSKIKIKVRPVLLSFTGLPGSGKTQAFKCFVKHHVNCNPLKTQMMQRGQSAAKDIHHYDLIATGDSQENYHITEATKVSSCILGILSAFQQRLNKEGRVPLLDPSETAERPPCFKNSGLNEHLQHIYQYLCESVPSGPRKVNEEIIQYANELMKLVPEESALINVWDIPTNKTVHDFLSTLRGHLTNNYMWLFLQLDRELGNLHEPPIIEDTIRDHATLMKWRPRLHYLLRSCRLSSSKVKQRKVVCTIFARHDETTAGGLQPKLKELEDEVQPASEHIDVSGLLNDRIEHIKASELYDHTDSNTVLKCLSKNLKDVISKTKIEFVPIAWVFLRSFFHHSKKKVISRNEFKALSKECGMDEQSQVRFSEFYTSFGSIFDLSLINPLYKYVIINPILFLRSLDKLFHPQTRILEAHPTITYAVVPEEAGRKILGDDWPAYIDALLCLNLATKLEYDRIEISPEVRLDCSGEIYYIPSIRTELFISATDLDSVHLITNIDTPGVFNQASFARYLLASLSQAKLVACKNNNETIIKDSSTTVTLVSYGPVTKIHFDKPNIDVCSAVVEAYDKMARKSRIRVKYKFVRMCIDDNTIPNARFLPSARYHVLPDESNLCQKCQDDGRKDELFNVWKKALTKNPIQPKCRPAGQLDDTEIDIIANKIATYDVDVIAKTFGFPIGYKNIPELEGLEGAHLVAELISLWDRNNNDIKKSESGHQEPRRAFARKLSELGTILSTKFKNADKVKDEFEKLASRVDLYYVRK